MAPPSLSNDGGELGTGGKDAAERGSTTDCRNWEATGRTSAGLGGNGRGARGRQPQAAGLGGGRDWWPESASAATLELHRAMVGVGATFLGFSVVW